MDQLLEEWSQWNWYA